MDFRDRAILVSSPDTPADEKTDIQAELFKEFRGELQDNLIPPDEIFEFSGNLPSIMKTQRSLQGEIVDEDDGVSLQKAQRANPYGIYPITQRGRHRSHLFVDELGIVTGGRAQHWVEKLTPFGFGALKSMVEHSPILNAVILTRIRNINSFSCPFRPYDEHPLGFTVVPKGKKIGDKLSESEKKVVDDIESFIMNCGDEPDPRKRKWILHRDNMTGFISKLIRDTLTCDACPIETELTMNGKRLSGFYSLPSETIRIAHEDGYMGDDRVIAVQIFNDQVVSFYTPNDLIYEVRNPRTDITMSRYGYAETEMFVRVVTGFLNAMTYNMAGFDRNTLPRGILTVYGKFDEKQLNFFKRQWNSMLAGPAQRWRLPVFVSTDGSQAAAKYEKVDSEFNEMHFSKWMTFLVSMICAIYTIAPEEINFDSFTSRTTSNLGGSDTAEKLALSKDKGLEPLISFLESIYNESLIPLINKGYEFHYVGLHRDDQKFIEELKMKVITVDEGRKMVGLEEHENPEIGEVPIDQGLLGYYQNLKMQEQQQAMQEQMGEEGQYGLPQDVIDKLKDGTEGQTEQGPDLEQLGMGGGMAGSPKPGGAKPKSGDQKLAAAERAVKKARRSFIVHSNIEAEPRDKYDGWRME